jgi:cell division protein FtsQ
MVIKGSLYIVDTKGEVFKKLEPQDDVQVPLLNGCHRNGKIDDALVRKALPLVEYLASRDVFPTREQVSEIYADTRYGFSIFTNRGLCFDLGFGNYEQKFARLTPVLRDLAKRNVDTAYLEINLSDRDKVIVRQRNAVGAGRVGRGYST